MIAFPGKAGELPTSIRLTAASLCLVSVRRENTGFGSVLLGDAARCRSHALIEFGSALGPADVAPPASRRGAVLF
jgi:hypothetical protein